MVAGVAGTFVGVLGVVVLWGAVASKSSDWWAAWGQWVGGIGSIAAAITALGIAWHGWSRADTERRDAEAAEAWYVTSEWTLKSNHVGQVVVRNDSDRPVLQVRVDQIRGPAASIRNDVVNAGGINLLPPGGSHPFLVKVPTQDAAPGRPLTSDLVATVSFTNMHGRWQRTGEWPPERARLGTFVKPGSRSRWFRRASEPTPPSPPGSPPVPPTSLA